MNKKVYDEICEDLNSGYVYGYMEYEIDIPNEGEGMDLITETYTLIISDSPMAPEAVVLFSVRQGEGHAEGYIDASKFLEMGWEAVERHVNTTAYYCWIGKEEEDDGLDEGDTDLEDWLNQDDDEEWGDADENQWGDDDRGDDEEELYGEAEIPRLQELTNIDYMFTMKLDDDKEGM